ncbi:TWO-COMPONENT HYBRID SENSOR AND REGULATOR, (fragment) [Desulfamplus magnetovallimortis]|uniref:TWO-COMPONENT HYBRID SENSOR AND REGULATOR n=1 Tax=Desulfamplus magnetovallimortis TaxID=1246637 RepID=A0A1W1H7T6_9BACT
MGKEITILAVDDSEINLDILVGILKRYDVIPALSGKEALEILQEEDVDLILLDVVMPEMDGFEVCRRIKADEKTREIPVIFITVKSSEQDIQKCFELGVVDYVAKPFNAIELLARVQTHLKLHSYQVRLEETVKEQAELAFIKNPSQFKQSLVQLIDITANMIKELEKKSTMNRKEITAACLQMQQTLNHMTDGL